MSISLNDRTIVRQRANFCCEFCGVHESDTGSELTIDHFQPVSKNGSDDLQNLVYSCHRCNSYKSDYFPQNENQTPLWNPRLTTFNEHFLALNDSRLQGLTPIGTFTINRLRLNRSSLVNYRLNIANRQENSDLLLKYREIILLQQQVNEKLNKLNLEQKKTLQEQQHLINILLNLNK